MTIVWVKAQKRILLQIVIDSSSNDNNNMQAVAAPKARR
jgi:hypothetical protein